MFLAIIGAQVDLRGINLNVLFLAGLIVAIAIITKLIGCGLPSLIFLKDRSKAMKVGIGMISRGEVGLIIAGVGITAGALDKDTYTSIIIMVAATTIITPIWLKTIYKKKEEHIFYRRNSLQFVKLCWINCCRPDMTLLMENLRRGYVLAELVTLTYCYLLLWISLFDNRSTSLTAV